jgi:PAS domain S-box-containing protein
MPLKNKDSDIFSFEKSAMLFEETGHLIPVGSWSFDLGLKKMTWSKKTFEILGFDPAFSEADANTIIASLPPEQQKDVYSFFLEKNKRASVANSFQIDFKKPSGERVFLNLVFDVLCDSENVPVRLSGIVQDITKWKTTEKELDKSESHYRNILDLSNIAMAIVAFDGKIEYINQQAVKTFGYMHEDIPDMDSWWLLAYPEETYRKYVVETYMGLVMKAIENKSEIERREYNATCKNGEIKTMVIFGVVVGDKIFVMFEDITERKQVELELKESKDAYSNLVQTLPVGVVIHSNGEIVFSNKAAAKIMEVSSIDALNHTKAIDFVHPDYKELALQRIKKLETDNSKARLIEEVFITFKGRKFFVEVTALPIAYNKIPSVLTVFNDITERKCVEEELKETKDRFEIIFDNGPDAILVTRINDGLYIDSNNTFTRYTGYTPDDLKGKSTLDIDIWKNPKDRDTLLNEVKAKGYCRNLELVVKVKDGTERTIDMSAEIIKLKGVTHLLSISRDIAERKKTEKALKDSEEKYRLLIEQAADGIFVGDKDGNFIEVNSKACELSKYSQKELLKMNMSELFTEEERRRVPLRYDLLMKGETVKSERMLTRKNGNLIPIEMNTRQMPNGTYQAIIRNISDRRKAEEFMLKYQEELEKLVKKRTKEIERTNLQLKTEVTERQKSEELIKIQLKEKEILLKEIHHRVKNNMQVIISLLNLQASTINDAKILDLYRESQNRIKSMALIHEKLYQSKDFSHIDFSDYLSSLAVYFSQIYQFENTTIDIVTKAHKIPFEFDTAITLGLIVNELVSNAMKYAFKHQTKGKITIELKKTRGNKIMLLLFDNGCGIPKSINYKKTKSLGLQLVCSLTEQIGGTLTLDNTKGAHFQIVFPIKY